MADPTGITDGVDFGRHGELCGWISAFVAAVCIGSFGVPVKGGPASKVNVDPLVMQSYKSAVCFLTCWLVTLLGEEITFTSWGILSGLFWVPGATAGIYGIRNAGLAVAVGTWSSLVVLSSFGWGIFVFEERVRSRWGACGACLTLCVGLVGMGRYSAPPPASSSSASASASTELVAAKKKEPPASGSARRKKGGTKGVKKDDDEAVLPLISQSRPSSAGSLVGEARIATPPVSSGAPRKRVQAEKSTAGGSANGADAQPAIPSEVEPFIPPPPRKNTDDPPPLPPLPKASSSKEDAVAHVVLCDGRLSMTRRQCGILGAVVNGTWGGTNMIPLHYASLEGHGGAGYTVSFACGSALVTLLLWLLRFLYHLRRTGSLDGAYDSLPSLHFREMWKAGLLSGVLYSLGNFGGILAVTHLGQGVGYSATQCAMLVSGLWGIFYFEEIRGKDRITKWMGAAGVALAGILWLSYEHEGEAAH